MKNLKIVITILVFSLVYNAGYSNLALSKKVVKKSNLKVLYVGVNPEKPLSKRDLSITAYPKRAESLQKRRTADFKVFLENYFKNVIVVYAEDYKEQMSAKFDVTIIDAYLPKLTEGGMVFIKEAGKEVYTQPTYLSNSYSAATIMIGEPSAFIGQGRQLKIDHLCLCLDAHAHSMKLDHPIFNTPNKVNVAYEDVTLTGNYKVRYGGRNLGEEMPMLRMQTEGYRDGKGFPIGLVSTGYNFDNGIDAEWISSGTCDKGIEATAIGRHANFFHWGFAAAPEFMTENAKLAFINSIHYIAPFKGAKQVTKKNKGVQLKKYLREQQWTLSDKGSAAWLHYINKDTVQAKENKLKLQERKDSGEELSDMEKMMLKMPIRKETRAWTIRHQSQELKDKFGEDWSAYENYYKENLDYFYPEKYGWYKMILDEDAKSLGIANDDIKLLDKAITMLKDKSKKEMAYRILLRYTKQTFKTDKEWISWFKKNHKNLYFSEGDGYKFIVI
ncbi:hypothetical protein [Cellulophaga fucicola]|uniref:Uncharacterized protein n=1 Tax=Cellulophaga fucicola TaxID=76595 RepID=A0A1K1MW88_9FLAO|nr:hypothetical protein [Cellulophaga fucicola]SFW27460.1 hypothetical protein SAMN05660313_00989 [Cellulophaga fucicola]